MRDIKIFSIFNILALLGWYRR